MVKTLKRVKFNQKVEVCLYVAQFGHGIWILGTNLSVGARCLVDLFEVLTNPFDRVRIVIYGLKDELAPGFAAGDGY